MPNIYPLLFIFAGTAVSAAMNESALRLEAEWNGQRLPIAAVENGQIILKDGTNKLAAPKGAIWHLEGDIRANANLIQWSPSYSVTGQTEAWASISHITREPSQRSPFLDHWPQGIPSGGIVVFAWLVEGQVVDTVVFPLEAERHSEGFSRQARFSLSPDTAIGQAIVLLWKNGGFEAPEPLFKRPATQRAMVAALLDDVDGLEQSLGAGARSGEFSRSYATLAHYAAEAGAMGTLQLLVGRDSRAANRNHRYSSTPLHWAAGKGRLKAVELLLDAGARVNAKSRNQEVPLDTALRYEHWDVVRSLIAANAGNRFKRRSTALLAPLLEGGAIDIADSLLKSGIDFDVASEEAARLLIRCAESGQLIAARWLAERGADANHAERGRTALLAVAGDGDRETTETLIAAGADPNKAGAAGLTPLMVAAERGRTDIAALLIKAGANLNVRSATGSTPLHAAARSNATEIVRQLCDGGAELKIRDNQNLSVLETALVAGSGEAAQELAKRGAAMDSHSDRIKELLLAALRWDIPEPLEVALEGDWTPESKLHPTWSILDLARLFYAQNCENLLLRHGAASVATPPPGPVVPEDLLDEPLTTIGQIKPHDPRPLLDVYPQEEVHIEIFVTAAGMPLFPKIVRSTDSRLNAAALEAVSRTRFTPPKRSGEEVLTNIVHVVRFSSSESRVFEVAQLDKRPIPISRTAPSTGQYSHIMRRPRIEGQVVLRFVVKADGGVAEIRVDHSDDKHLESAAIDAVLNWKFEPGEVDGSPVSTRVRQEFNFKITGTWPDDPLHPHFTYPPQF